MSIINLDLSNYQQDFNVSKEDKLEYGEIYTPFLQINNMLNLFDPIVFNDPTKKWLDVGAGLGYFMIILFERLNSGLLKEIPDENERKTHIIENMIYMIEIKESNVLALKKMFGEKANIFHINFCDYSAQSHVVSMPMPIPMPMPDKFDYVIGNPPYNSRGIKKVPTNTKIKKTQEGCTIWSTFVIKSLDLLKEDTGKLCMIIPSIWLKQDKEQIHNLLTNMIMI